MKAKVQIEVTMKIGSNDESISKQDLFSKAFEMEQKLNLEFPEFRVHVGAMEQAVELEKKEI